ncbi:MAG TPA: N-acetylgalactosamine 6-sulfate sulfatase, partial [Planctomycetaceae bacterium]|nr:N-acetylgalactosamine 6-sulfate sulfatase [Planctomycetaceae bacterium]
DRVLREKRFKLWVDADRRPIKLFDLIADPWEEQNLIDSKDAAAMAARERLAAVALSFPEKDGAPIYDKNPPQKWDKK